MPLQAPQGLRRAPLVRIYDVLDRTVVLAADGARHELAGDSAALARAVLALLEQAHTRDELLAALAEAVGAPIEHTGAIDELLALLLRARVLEPAAPPPPRRHGPRVLLGLTGAVATMHAPALVQLLQGRGCELRVAATAEALRFVGLPDAVAANVREIIYGAMLAALMKDWPEDETVRDVSWEATEKMVAEAVAAMVGAFASSLIDEMTNVPPSGMK